MNRQITLASRPQGFPVESDFKIFEEETPSPRDGEFLAEILYLSVDPYMRGRMNDAKSYAEPVGIGDMMVGECVARVVQSKNDRFPEGLHVAGMFGWQEYAVSDGTGVRKLRPEVEPISTALHILGMPGMTAYFGLFDICQPKPGQTIVVSGAAGAVGSAVGQMSKLSGCHVVGIAGSDEKTEFITTELGFDAGLNYKKSDDIYGALTELCPDGVDVYFDNVGGPITDAIFPQLNVGARVAICGQISQYNTDRQQQGPRLFWHLIIKRATVRGFLVMDYADRFREALTTLSKWYTEGNLNYRERVTDGLENAPRAFIEMMQGANIGKQLVRLTS